MAWKLILVHKWLSSNNNEHWCEDAKLSRSCQAVCSSEEGGVNLGTPFRYHSEQLHEGQAPVGAGTANA